MWQSCLRGNRVFKARFTNKKLKKQNLSQSLLYMPDFQKITERERERDSDSYLIGAAWVAHCLGVAWVAPPRPRPGNVRRGLSRAMGCTRCMAWVSRATQATRKQTRDSGRAQAARDVMRCQGTAGVSRFSLCL